MLCTPSSGLSSSGGSGLQLFLSNNRLVSSAVSAALFRVQSLRILTLRENALDELPSAIGLLSGLRELSIGGNRLVRCDLPVSANLRSAGCHMSSTPSVLTS